MKNYYVTKIIEMANDCHDLELLDLICKLLSKNTIS